MKKKKLKPGALLFDLIIYVSLLILFVVTLYPMWFVLIASFSSVSDVALSGGLLLWPKQFVTGAYKMVFANAQLVNGFKNSVLLLIMSLPINIVLTLLCGYFMASTNMFWKKPIILMIMFTMFFSGGMVPYYLNIKDLGLMNTLWSLVLPGALSVYNAIICKTAMEAIPTSLSESAFVDGANDFQIIWKILVPLLKPTIAVLLLYYGVGVWNSWFYASIFIRDKELLPIQNVLQSILKATSESAKGLVSGDKTDSYAEAVKYATIVISVTPIMCIYPFLQKYFAKGAMIGAVKG